MIPTIETKRTILRPFENKDVEGLFELDSNPEVHRFLGNKPVTNREQCIQVIEAVLEQYEKYGLGRWTIIEKETGSYIGWAGLKYETQLFEDFHYYDLGYRLQQLFWGQGLGYEVAEASLVYGIHELKLEEINAAVHVDNIASNRIIQKLGFTWVKNFMYEGEQENWYVFKANKGQV